MDERGEWPGEVFARRLAQVRGRKRWSQEELARRTKDIGSPISRETIAKIESGGQRARNVKLEEVLALSYALGVPPLHMFVPFEADGRLRIVSRRRSVSTIIARRWLRAQDTLDDEDPAFFFSELPIDEVRRLAELAGAHDIDLPNLLREVGFDTRSRTADDTPSP